MDIMPKKYKTGYSSDEELQEAYKNANAEIYYNIDGSYAIEYNENNENKQDTKDKEEKDEILIATNIFNELVNYCDEECLSLLNMAQLQDFIDFVKA